MKKYVYLVFTLFSTLSACQEDVVESPLVEKVKVKNSVSFTFVYKEKEYVESIDYLPSSLFDIPLPKENILLEAMQQSSAAIFVNSNSRKIHIFDSVNEAKEALNVSSINSNNTTFNQRNIHQGLVVLHERPNFEVPERGSVIGLGVGGFIRDYKERIPDLSNLRFSEVPVNLDRAISSIRISNSSPSKWLTALFYEHKNYRGRALVIQCPPDMARPPIDYDASFVYANLQGVPGTVRFAREYLPYFTDKCSQGYVKGLGSTYNKLWDNRIRSVEAFFSSKEYSSECVPF